MSSYGEPGRHKRLRQTPEPRRWNPQRAAEDTSEVAVAGEARLGRDRRKGLAVIAQPLERLDEAQLRSVAVKRRARVLAKDTCEVELRDVQLRRESSQGVRASRTLCEERFRVLDECLVVGAGPRARGQPPPSMECRTAQNRPSQSTEHELFESA